jgi:hypothetical protein
MNCRWVSNLRCLCVLPLLLAVAAAQAEPPDQAPVSAPVSYASVSQLNLMLTQLEQASRTAQSDLSGLRIDHWRADSTAKRQSLANVESIQRNLKEALPGMIAELRASPESLPPTFKLYRNLDALYNVFGSVVELAGAYGSKDDFQSLNNDLNAFEKSRLSFANRMETLAGAKEAELARLRVEVRNAQAEANPVPKKIIIDDTEPVKKKTVKKKTSSKTSKATKSDAAKTAPPK